MSLKLGFIIFYVGFLFFYIFFTLEMGVTVLNIDTNDLQTLVADGAFELTGIGFFDFFIIMVNTIISFFAVFGFFLTISVRPEFAFMNFIFVPMTVGMVYLIFEFIRGGN